MNRTLRRIFAAAATVAAAATIVPLMAAAPASAAGTLSGNATLSVRSGTSATPFTLNLPAGATCTGDSSNAFYGVTSYMVPITVDPATLQFDPTTGPNPNGLGGEFRQPLYETVSGSAFTGRQTADANTPGGPGPIINIGTFDLSSAGFAPGDIPAGAYNLGIACILGPADGDQLHEFWNTTMTVKADDAGGPAKISWTAGAGYTGVTPFRICDTRAVSGTSPANQCNTGPGAGKLGANSARDVQVTGLGGVPASGVSSVVVNVTAVSGSAASFLTVYPQGTVRPNAANLNWAAGKVVPNLVEVPVSASGKISVWNSVGNVDLVVDVQGYSSQLAVGKGVFNPVSPARICDSRGVSGGVSANQCNGNGAGQAPIGPAGTKDVQVTGRGGVPASGVSAVVLNVAVTGTTGASFLTVYPKGQALPNAANVNWAIGQTTSNRVIVPVGTDGKITIRNSTGNTQVIVDVNGWFTDASSPSATGSVYNALAPTRVCDSRAAGGSIPSNQCNSGGASPIGPGGTKTVTLTGGVVPAGAKAVVLNVAVTGTTGNSFLTAYPNGTARPNTADINWATGQTVSNLVVVKLPANGQVDIWQQLGSTHVIIDVQGYYL